MSNNPLCNIRMFHAGRFTVCLDALEDRDFDPSYMDPETSADMREGIESGRYVLPSQARRRPRARLTSTRSLEKGN